MPGRVAALEAVESAIEAVLDEAMRQSCSIEEWTRKRRMAALKKVDVSIAGIQLVVIGVGLMPCTSSPIIHTIKCGRVCFLLEGGELGRRVCHVASAPLFPECVPEKNIYLPRCGRGKWRPGAY